MGNSSSKSEKKQKKEEQESSLGDALPTLPPISTLCIADIGPPLACSSPCPPDFFTRNQIEVSPSPLIAPILEPSTIETNLKPITELVGPSTEATSNVITTIEPTPPISLLPRPRMACSSINPAYLKKKKEKGPTPKAPSNVTTELKPLVAPTPSRPKMACSSAGPRYRFKKKEKEPAPITTEVTTSIDSSLLLVAAPPQMACSAVDPRHRLDESLLTLGPRPPTNLLLEKGPPLACSSLCPDDFFDPLPEEDSLFLTPKSSSPLDLINLSIDLFPVAKHLFRFLEAIDEVPRDPIKNLMAFALHRYNKWLDFINWCIETGQDDVDHRPPFDIEVVWVAHVIRTDEYKSDCLKLFGREIPHVFDHKSGAHTSVSETTRKLWKERTGSDLVMNTEKFFSLASVFASNLTSGSIIDQNKTSITVCILIEDMKWFHDFRDFYPHSLVSLLSDSSSSSSPPIISEEEEIQQNLKKEFGAKETPLDLEISDSDKTFLEEAHRDYLRFLALQKKYNFTRGPGSEEGAGKVCATYKIDLFWHSHMLNTREYRRDCESYLGDIVPHSPWPTEAVSVLHNKFNFTADLWQREFGDEFQSTKL